MIKPVNAKQAQQLKEVKAMLNGTIKVKIEDHSRLNTSKGVIFCPDFECVTDKEFEDNVKDQNIVQVRRITRKVNGEVKPTHVFVVTLDTPVLPTEFKAAYLNIPVRPFILQPLRRYKCQRFGHFTIKCNCKDHICGVCSEIVEDPTIK